MTSILMPYAYFRRKVRPAEEARISIAAHSLQYGTACFTGIRGHLRNSKIRLFRPKDHFERIMNAVKILGFDFSMDYSTFDKMLAEMIAKNKPTTDLYVRPFVLTEEELLTPRTDKMKFDLAVYMIPLGDYLDTSRGLKLMVSSWRKFADTTVSTKAKACGMYLHSSLARTQANQHGYDEALVMDDQGNLVEGSGENMFIVYRGEVIMPPTGASALEGITLRTVIEFLREEGIPIRFEPIDRSMAYTCDELLLTGTAAQVLFADSLDGRAIGKTMGPICTLLRKKFSEAIEMKHKKSKEWIKEYKI